MSFISYAQNLEDVMLYRALKHIESGFYIDVGAQHPVIDSLTKAFSDRGWHGINIEPNLEYFPLLQQERPKDVNLNIALSSNKGKVPYYKVPQTGMSTIRKTYAKRYTEAGYDIQTGTVPCTTLDEVCADYKVDTVHFLSIDVEGAEKAVLQGFAFKKVRPWIVVIEANEPLSVKDVSQHWESILLDKNYEYVYYDGLNRFYIASERQELKTHFNAPPNFFDDYIAYGHLATQQELTKTRAERDTQQQELEQIRAERNKDWQELAQTWVKRDKDLQELAKTRVERDKGWLELERTRTERDTQQQEIQNLQQAISNERTQRENLVTRLQDIYASRSWRWTGPMRKTKLFIFSILKKLLKPVASVILRILVRIGPLKRFGARLINSHPTFKNRLRRLAGIDKPASFGAPPAYNLVPVKRNTLLLKTLKLGLKVLNRFPRSRHLVRRAIARFPRFEKRFFQIWLDATWADIVYNDNLEAWSVTAPLNTINAVAPGKSLTIDTTALKNTIYYWITDTVKVPVNTGVQRVTRCLAGGLMAQQTELVFVCWDNQSKALVKATRADIEYLSSMNGPTFSPEFLASYTNPTGKAPLLHEQLNPEQLAGSWLVVPEVINKVFKGSTPTPGVIDYARTHHMKTAFIFYDAISLKLNDYTECAIPHAEYMQYLAFADLVIPISQFAAKDLAGYLIHNQGYYPETLSAIEPILLPSEICGTARVTEYPENFDEIIILCVGTIEPRKNQLTLVAAFHNLCERFPDAPLVLIFSGNLHPKVTTAFREALRRNPKIKYMEYASDAKIARVYKGCAFTVFASVEEGFGLPIAESLWYGRPVICANFGSMAEIAQGGGCLTIDTHTVSEMEKALERMAFDKSLRKRLAAEAVSIPLLSWRDYAGEVLGAFHSFDDSVRKIKKIYYWIDHTCTYPSNSGIQRVVRGLAGALQRAGMTLIPVKWDNVTHSFYSPNEKEISHLAEWNGPDPSRFSRFAISGDESGSWLLVPELTSDLGDPGMEEVVRKAKAIGLHTAIVFYDALPYKLAQLYAPNATINHTDYMKKLLNFDCILPISNASGTDLQAFLFHQADRLVNIDKKLNPVLLPGEFLKHPRVTKYKEPDASTIRILCVCTIEPRKNHLTLLESFDKITREKSIDAELILVGHCTYPDLEVKVNDYLERNHRIHWLRHIDDVTLGNEYTRCHFTVYPSLDEGFGLPVLESLWYGRPCICRNTGALLETAEGGGCLTVNTSDVNELARAITLLATDKKARAKFGAEAVSRRLKTWDEYARGIIHQLGIKTGNNALELSIKPAPWPFPPKSKQPLLSICITTYNRDKWLSLSLKTLMRWTEPYRDLIEVVVCDNASTDDTGKVAKPFLKKKNFRYHCNPENVGMLGNLKVTANLARGKYVWILGDDDLVKEGAVEAVISAIQEHPDTSLVYLNYSYTRVTDADKVGDIDEFLRNSTPIVPPTPNQYAKIKDIAPNSENFFTAIYCLIFRRDHAVRAYSQNTNGRPFSTLLTCIPTSYYVCNHMFEEMGLWVGQPSVVVNMNVSWLKYASLWLLERVPELYDLAEEKGASPDAVDRWRTDNFLKAHQALIDIYFKDTEDNLIYFSIERFIQRYKHLPIFKEYLKSFIGTYSKAYAAGKTAGSPPPETLIQRYNLSIIK